MTESQLLPIEAIMQPKKADQWNTASTPDAQPSKILSRASGHPDIPGAVSGGLPALLPPLLAPQNRRSSASTNGCAQPQRSNLTALLEGSQGSFETETSDQKSFPDSNKQIEADSASGPTRTSYGGLAKSAPAMTPARVLPPSPEAIPSTFVMRPPPSLSSSMGGEDHNRLPNLSEEQVRRCISSKELGSLVPKSGSPFTAMLYQREIIQATLQQRLMDSRRSGWYDNGRPLSPPIDSQSIDSDLSTKKEHHHLSNETRNRRRAEHTRAVTRDLCAIVTDLFVAEAKLLKPAIYGLEKSLNRDQVLRNVIDFVSALPPRYAMGVDTPSEVLLHMRLMSAARSDPLRAVVHITRNSQSSHLVTISCGDANGLLEYISRLLATGGSRVLDADVMLSTDSIVLDRFVVQMEGRLRLDKFSQSIETFLSESRQRASQSSSEDDTASAEKSTPDLSPPLAQATGPLYFHPPKYTLEASPKVLQREIDSAVPLSQVLAYSASGNALNSLVPLRRSTTAGGLPRGNSFILQPVLSTPDDSSTSSAAGNVISSPAIPAEPSSERRRRTLVKREATSFGDPEEDQVKPPIDFLTVLAPPTMSESAPMEDRIIPLIPFEELMLIETLGMGRVSTIYRAAWQQMPVEGEPTSVLNSVEMVALKVATVNADTCDHSHVDELRREADIAGMLQHSNVCDLVGIAADAECFCLAYEFCEGGSLLSLLSDTSRYYEYLPIALDIANGMAYLHSRQVIHRDLKPSNVLLTRDHRAKISDFGMSVANRGQELTAETGTYRYMAPEVIRHESYSSNADVYSFGILLWQLITREVPFATKTPIQAAFSVAEGRRPEIPSSTPARLSEIISACWDQDSHKRPSFTYIAMALADYARMAFSPANVGAQTLQIANEMLATVEGNSTINVDFSTPLVDQRRILMQNAMDHASDGDIGLDIE